MRTNNTRQMATDPRVTKLRQQWNHSRKQSRRIAANVRKTRGRSRALVKQWKLMLAQSKEMHRAREKSIDRSITGAPAVATVQVFVATARRVPWRRVQMDDLNGPVSVWYAPGCEGM